MEEEMKSLLPLLLLCGCAVAPECKVSPMANKPNLQIRNITSNTNPDKAIESLVNSLETSVKYSASLEKYIDHCTKRKTR